MIQQVEEVLGQNGQKTIVSLWERQLAGKQIILMKYPQSLRDDWTERTQ